LLGRLSYAVFRYNGTCKRKVSPDVKGCNPLTGTRHPREEIKEIIAQDKPAYVRSLFDSIARDYDRMNWIMTGGLLALWHRSFIRQTGLGRGERALDVCCGTGDLALLMARRVGSSGRVVGVDFSPNMLAIAQDRSQKAAQEKGGANGPLAQIEWRQGDALALDFPDGGPEEGFHCTTMGFALRNVGDVARSLAEMARVTRSGGRVVCLEVSRPHRALVRAGFSFYFYRVVPMIGRMAERGLPEGSALRRLRPYTYLPYSLDHLPPPDAILAMMRDGGLERVRRIPLTGGAVALYVGEKP